MDVYGLVNRLHNNDMAITLASLCDYLHRSESFVLRMIERKAIDRPLVYRYRASDRTMRKRKLWSLEYILRWSNLTRKLGVATLGWEKGEFPTADFDSRVAITYTQRAETIVRDLRCNAYLNKTTVQSNAPFVHRRNLLQQDKVEEIARRVGSDVTCDVVDITTADRQVLSDISTAFECIHSNGNTFTFRVPKGLATPLYSALRRVGCVFQQSHAGFFNNHHDAIVSVTLVTNSEMKNNLELATV